MSVEVVNGKKGQSTDEDEIGNGQMPNVTVRNGLSQLSIFAEAVKDNKVSDRSNDKY